MPIHPISPVFDEHSQILILGSFPSVQSRAQGFFYGHPQNRFWRVLAAVMQDAPPCTVAERRAFLLRHRIAVWDVIASCDIVGSSDAKIRNAEVNDLSPILSAAPIQQIFVNGQTAARLYHRWRTQGTVLCVHSSYADMKLDSPYRDDYLSTIE